MFILCAIALEIVRTMTIDTYHLISNISTYLRVLSDIDKIKQPISGYMHCQPKALVFNVERQVLVLVLEPQVLVLDPRVVDNNIETES
jgi:hypothetical protein